MFGKLSISLFVLIIFYHDLSDAQKKKEVTCLYYRKAQQVHNVFRADCCHLSILEAKLTASTN